MRYEATHLSAHDGSDAMKLGSDDKPGEITLVNEDGFIWTDPAEQWEPING